MNMNYSYVEIKNLEEYRQYRKLNIEEYEERANVERHIAQEHRGAFVVEGFDPILKEASVFSVSKERPIERNGVKLPHWRESLVCNKYHLNARLRATLLLYSRLANQRTKKIYLTERITPLYSYFEDIIKPDELLGSEYFGTEYVSGETVNNVRHEDLTNSSFEDGALDAVVCLEVLEHIPDYAKALKEIYRILNKDGFAIFSAPFIPNKFETTIRASMVNGQIFHILEPEYHGDPINKKGVLCFQHFGWDVIELLREIGFSKVYVTLLWSKEYGILGIEQLMWYARK